jgi:hypothetical protein
MHILKSLRLLIASVIFLGLFATLSLVPPTTFAAAKPTPAPAPLSKADMRLLTSLVPTVQEHTKLNKAISVPKIVGTFGYGNAGRVQATLRSSHLSPALKQAIQGIITSVSISTSVNSSTKATALHPLYNPTCQAAPSVYGYLAGKNALGWTLWSYSVRQPFYTDSSYQICDYGARQVDARPYYPGWSLGNEEGNEASCCPADIWWVNNVGTFTYTIGWPVGIVIETVNAHIDMSMYGDGTSDVSLYEHVS